MILRIAREKVGHRQGPIKTKRPTTARGWAFAFVLVRTFAEAFAAEAGIAR